MIDLEDLKVPHGAERFKFTEITGQYLYAAFMIIAVVMMLNALIAMMSSTYTAVEVMGRGRCWNTS